MEYAIIAVLIGVVAWFFVADHRRVNRNKQRFADLLEPPKTVHEPISIETEVQPTPEEIIIPILPVEPIAVEEKDTKIIKAPTKTKRKSPSKSKAGPKSKVPSKPRILK